jgi:hypothetical protein
MKKLLIAASIGLLALAGVAIAQQSPVAQFVPGFRTISGTHLNGIVDRINSRNFANVFSKIATADDGTTQTLTGAMVTGGNLTYHVTTGGSTPSLTLPLATAMNTTLPGMPVNGSYTLRIVNSNSGTATVVTNTGWTTSGTLTLATNTWREFVIVKSGALTYTITSVGTGTNS